MQFLSFLLLSIFIHSTFSKPLLDLSEARQLEHTLDKAQLYDRPSISFDSTPKDVTVKVGETIELRCKVVAVPGAVIYWSLDGQRLEQDVEGNLYEKVLNAGRKTVANVITEAKLRIPCASKRYRGIYKCIATNGHQTVEASARVSVVGAARPKRNCTRERAPYISLWTYGRFEDTDNAVILVCRAKGSNVQTSWYNGDRELLNNLPGYHVLPNGDLIIAKASWEKLGDYICVASNEHGEDRETGFFYPTSHSDEPEQVGVERSQERRR